MWFLTDPWWQNHKIWPTFGQVIFLVLDFQAQTLDHALPCQSHHILITLLLDTIPKRKLFNIANLGAWAKSTITKFTKENVSNCTEILKKLLTFLALSPITKRSQSHQQYVIGMWEHPSCQYAKVCNLIMSVCRCLPTWFYQKASCMGWKNIPRALCDAQDPRLWLR